MTNKTDRLQKKLRKAEYRVDELRRRLGIRRNPTTYGRRGEDLAPRPVPTCLDCGASPGTHAIWCPLALSRVDHRVDRCPFFGPLRGSPDGSDSLCTRDRGHPNDDGEGGHYAGAAPKGGVTR